MLQHPPYSETISGQFARTVTAYLGYLGRLIPDIGQQTAVSVFSAQNSLRIFIRVKIFPFSVDTGRYKLFFYISHI